MAIPALLAEFVLLEYAKRPLEILPQPRAFLTGAPFTQKSMTTTMVDGAQSVRNNLWQAAGASIVRMT